MKRLLAVTKKQDDIESNLRRELKVLQDTVANIEAPKRLVKEYFMTNIFINIIGTRSTNPVKQ